MDHSRAEVGTCQFRPGALGGRWVSTSHGHRHSNRAVRTTYV